MLQQGSVGKFTLSKVFPLRESLKNKEIGEKIHKTKSNKSLLSCKPSLTSHSVSKPGFLVFEKDNYNHFKTNVIPGQ